MTYDAFGRMVEQNRSGTYSEILYSPIGKLALMTRQITQNIFLPLPGGEQATYTSQTIRFRHTDWLGSSRFESNINEQEYGDVAYAPFGENYAVNNTPYLGFTGQNQDTVGGTYDFLYREYNPTQGRWISPDPAGLRATSFGDPQSFNRYAYVENGPLNSTDPVGLWCLPFEIKQFRRCPVFQGNGSWSEWTIMSIFFSQMALSTVQTGDVTARIQGGPDISETKTTYNDLSYSDLSLSSLLSGIGGDSNSTAANNDSFLGYLRKKPWVVSWILPVAGPVPGVIGVGPAGSVAWNPQTNNLCVGGGLGASAGHNVSVGPLLSSSGDVDSILSGWSISGGANLPFPTPATGLGWQVIANSSGVAQGPTAGVAGLSGSVTWSACAKLF